MSKILKELVVGNESYDVGYSKTTADITVAGVGTTGIGTGDIKDDFVIPAGTDLDSFLNMLLVKTIYPTITNTAPEIKGSFSSTIAISLDLTTGTTVEVGTPANLTNAKTVDTIVSATDAKVSGLKYGYSDTIDGDIITVTDGVLTQDWTSKSVNTSSTSKISVTAFSGFSGTKPSDVTKSDGTLITMADSSNTKSLGTITENPNKITCTFTPYNVTGTHPGIASKYIVSNTKQRSESEKTTAIAARNSVTDGVNTQTSTVTINGRYKYFIGWVGSNDGSLTLTSDIIRNTDPDKGKIGWVQQSNGSLMTTTSHSLSITESFKGESKSIYYIAVPDGYVVSQLLGDLGNSILGDFTKTTLTLTIGGTATKTYNVYKYVNTTSNTLIFKNIIIKKDNHG